jgi:hypothetical protein
VQTIMQQMHNSIKTGKVEQMTMMTVFGGSDVFV